MCFKFFTPISFDREGLDLIVFFAFSSFDKMAEEAERMARIERKGFQSHKKNLSTVKLG